MVSRGRKEENNDHSRVYDIMEACNTYEKCIYITKAMKIVNTWIKNCGTKIKNSIFISSLLRP